MAKAPPLDGIDQPWQRFEDEPANWYSLFWDYCALGPARTKQKAWNLRRERGEVKGKVVSGAYIAMALEWRWVERAAAFDAWVIGQEQAAYIERRKKAKGRRLDVIDAALDEAVLVLGLAKKNKVDFDKAITALDKVLKAQRAEFDDEPIQRHSHELGAGSADPQKLMGELAEQLYGPKANATPDPDESDWTPPRE